MSVDYTEKKGIIPNRRGFRRLKKDFVHDKELEKDFENCNELKTF